MKRDTLKTFAGLLIIGVIVVATFLYGNSQRQSQLKNDQNVKKQQQAKADEAKKAQPSTSASATATKTPAGQANTAPVQSPGSNKLQSPGTPTPNPTPTPAVAGAQTAPQTVPVTGGSNLPDTGTPVAGVLGAVGLLGAVVVLRRSKKSLFNAARTPH